MFLIILPDAGAISTSVAFLLLSVVTIEFICVGCSQSSWLSLDNQCDFLKLKDLLGTPV